MSFQNSTSVKKSIASQLLKIVLISIAIGLGTSLLMGGTLIKSVEAYLWNAGYSISIGIPLFLNGFFFEKFASRFIDWINKPVKSLLTALCLHFIYTTVVIFLVNWFWFDLILNQNWDTFWGSNKGTIISEYIIFIIIAAIIYAMSFFNSWRIQVQETEKVKSETLALRYKVLQDQINPHFLFNSLNVLTSLIKLEPDLAEQFTEHLSKVYRYVLENKDNDLVNLHTELDFLDAYVFLLHIRFMDKIVVKVDIDDDKKELLILPLALQLLIENAIKHNSMSKKNPLKIEITIENKNVLNVVNNLQERESHMASTGVGLRNIEHRYHLLEMPKPEFIKTDTKFIARIPLKC